MANEIATLNETKQITAGDFNTAGQVSALFKNTLKKLGVNPSVVRRFAIAAYESELNLVIHSLGGQMTMNVFPDVIWLYVDDKGPGIEDISLAMQEGYSTASEEIRMLGFGAGMGLANMKRCADEFNIESVVGKGTSIKMRFKLEREDTK